MTDGIKLQTERKVVMAFKDSCKICANIIFNEIYLPAVVSN